MLLRVFLILLLFPVFSRAEDSCSTVENLAKDLGPVHDQKELSWCYAFTTADIVSQKLQSQAILKPGERIHPLQVAADLHLMRGANPIDSTDFLSSPATNIRVLNAGIMNNAKLCKQTELGPEVGLDSPIFHESLMNSAKYFEDLTLDSIDPICEPRFDYMAKMNRLPQDMRQIERKTWFDTLAEKCTVEASPFSINIVYPEGAGPKSKKGKLPPSAKDAKILREALDLSLNKGSMAAIRYIPDFMTKNQNTGGGFHWSSIVGREKRADGKCYYQIRNSWGSGCDFYKDPSLCKDGYVWQPADKLIENMTTVIYIK